MPLFKCLKCHHEWESVFPKSCCDWCGSPGKIIQEKTSFEEFIEEYCKQEKSRKKKKR